MSEQSIRSQVIILAGGRGSRMISSKLPKVMHVIGNKPMLEMVFENAKQITNNDIILVYSKALKPYLSLYSNVAGCTLVLQPEPKGTADAVYCTIPFMSSNVPIAVIYGDNPFISAQIINQMFEYLETTRSAAVTLSFYRDNPKQYGRIITDEADNFIEIVEFKNATDAQKQIKLCNSGVMVFASGILQKYLPHLINEHSNRETYLTEIIKLCSNHYEKVSYLLSTEHDKIIGVNTQEELKEANKIFYTHNSKCSY